MPAYVGDPARSGSQKSGAKRPAGQAPSAMIGMGPHADFCAVSQSDISEAAADFKRTEENPMADAVRLASQEVSVCQRLRRCYIEREREGEPWMLEHVGIRKNGCLRRDT